ncbi:hypothetical protein [Halalkalibacter nanhaiisediminis]|uniref:LTXXQ motif family protein n=1 Tax=Halalkalibacter nanhaiisediminis TaxID=688079 RepID=A0A562QGP2_9BACI|nr:hypothetical protein [Halalkalibacter nanhaiisediminis]TWI55927.1 hypothetical protein IQ10_02492 [Halalkalibacter nanhaiisediminis]
MKRFYQGFMFLQMAAVLALAVTFLAPVQAEDVEQEQERNCHQCEMKVRNELKVHLDYYYEMLVEKYAPTKSEKWQDVRNERDLLQKKLKEAKQRGELSSEKMIDKEWMEEHRNLQQLFNAAVEKRDENQLQQLLPQMIEHYEKLNDLYKQRLKMSNSL